MGGATPAQIRRLAMDYLARREHGYAELVGKLVQRGVGQSEAAAAVGRLASEGLQDDTRFADAYLRAQAGRGKGPLYICNGLRQRGLSSRDAEQAIQRVDQDWAASAIAVANRKYGETPCSYSERSGRLRFLLQRGFTPEQASTALRALDKGSETADEIIV